MKYEFTDKPNASDIAEIREGLREFNLRHKEVKDTKDLAIFVTGDDGKKIAGVVGETYGLWLYVKFLWVDDAFKGLGIGRQLLSQIEQKAMDVGCEYVLLDTYSFQAKPFYEKQGYSCVLTLDNYPVTQKMHYLTKSLKK